MYTMYMPGKPEHEQFVRGVLESAASTAGIAVAVLQIQR